MKEFKVDGIMTIVNVLQGSGMVASASEVKEINRAEGNEVDGKIVNDWGVNVEIGSVVKKFHKF